MPKRSNIFQRLVLEIHRELGAGWSVQESVELHDKVTGEDREVDIVAQATVGGYPMLMCIEVRDRGRRADVAWVEGIAKKHEHLPTNKLILWSVSGFTASALSKAAHLGIEAVTPGGLPDASWAVLARQLIGGSVKWLRPAFAPAVVDVQLADGSLTRWDAPPTMILSHADGKQIAVAAIVERAASDPRLRSVLLDHAPEGSGTYHVQYSTPNPCIVVGPSGIAGDLKRLLVEIRTECEVAPLTARSALHGGTVTTLAEAPVADGRLKFVARESPDEAPTLKGTHEPIKREPK